MLIVKNMKNTDKQDVEAKYRGKSPYRYEDNPMEKAFALEWQDQCANNSTLEYLLSNKDNRLSAMVNTQEQMATNTVMQWLGSPIGQSFLATVLAREESFSFLESLIRYNPDVRNKLKKILK